MTQNLLPELLLPDASSWRAWLEANHETSPGAHLVLHKSGGDVTTLTYDAAVEEALCFGWIDGLASRRDEGSWRVRMTPRRPRSNWSESNVSRVERLRRDGRMHESGHAAVEAAKADGRWPGK
ncbi:MAG TPA: hypothetical protein VF148_12390 [Acidimicrobiia bacterium]